MAVSIGLGKVLAASQKNDIEYVRAFIYAHAHANRLARNLNQRGGLPRARTLFLNFDSLQDFSNKAIKFNSQKVEKISAYLKGNLWIVKCLNSGATVSAKVREHILAGLFRPEGA